MVNFEKTSKEPTPSKSFEEPTDNSETSNTPIKPTFSPPSNESPTPLKIITPKKLLFLDNQDNSFHAPEKKIYQNKFNCPFYPYSLLDEAQRDFSELNEPMDDSYQMDIYKINERKLQKHNNNKTSKGNKDTSGFVACANDFKKHYKTEICKNFKNGFCKFGDHCAFAHGEDELRSKVTNSTCYRSKPCEPFFENGYCPYGLRCQFYHELKSNIINNPYDINITYGARLGILSKSENVKNTKELKEKSRLDAFKDIYENDERKNENPKYISKLFEDIKEIANVIDFSKDDEKDID